MATITKRKTGWLVQVRRKGYTPRCKTFRTKGEAQTWAREQEAEIDRGGLPPCDRTLKTETLATLLDRYLREITPRKLSCDTETQRLRKLQKHSICLLPIRELRPSHLSAYRDERLKKVKPGTIRRELGLLHHLFDVAGREWGLPLAQNPLQQVALPALRNARDRRLEAGEGEKLEKALSTTRNEHVAPIVLLGSYAADRPVGRTLGLGVKRALDHLRHLRIGNCARAAGAVFVGEPFDAICHEPPPPLTDRVLVHVEALGDLLALGPSAHSRIMRQRSDKERGALCRRTCASRKERSSMLNITASATRPAITSPPDNIGINERNYGST